MPGDADAVAVGVRVRRPGGRDRVRAADIDAVIVGEGERLVMRWECVEDGDAAVPDTVELGRDDDGEDVPCDGEGVGADVDRVDETALEVDSLFEADSVLAFGQNKVTRRTARFVSSKKYNCVGDTKNIHGTVDPSRATVSGPSTYPDGACATANAISPAMRIIG